MTDCKCGHGKKEHGWNKDARARTDACNHREQGENGTKHCGCKHFEEPKPGDWFAGWEETIRTLKIRSFEG